MPEQPTTILVVHHDAAFRAQLSAELGNKGYAVVALRDDAHALAQLGEMRPHGIIAELTAGPGDGLHFCAAVRAQPRLTGIPLVLVCPGPVDERGHAAAVQAGATEVVAESAGIAGILAALTTRPAPRRSVTAAVAQLRGKFVEAARADLERLLASEVIDVDTLRHLAHRWAGVGGTVGLPRVSQRAIELEAAADLPNAATSPAVRSHLAGLRDLLSDTEGAPSVPVEIAGALNRRRFALIGFSDSQSAALARALERAGAFTQVLPPGAPSGVDGQAFDAFLIAASSEMIGCGWMQHAVLISLNRPVLVLGSRESLLAHSPALRGAADFLVLPCQPEEVLLRSYQAITSAPTAAASVSTPAPVSMPAAGKPRVVIADDDATITELIAATLANDGIECSIAHSGSEAVELVRRIHPDVVVLDVNMPQCDGFQALATLKQEPAVTAIPVIMLTARRQESDIMRGFALRADDYVVKPFSPMELAMRIKRLMRDKLQPAASRSEE